MILYKRIGGKGQPGKETEYTYGVAFPEDLKLAGLTVMRDKVEGMFEKNSLVVKSDLLAAISQLNFVVNIQNRARIEAAIRYLDELDKKSNLLFDKHHADLLRWVLGQPQDTWTDKDFGLEEEK